MSKRTWHLVTGEYPPSPGGVSDYTQQLAHSLSQLDHTVEVWTGGYELSPVREDNHLVHRSLGDFESNQLQPLRDRLERKSDNSTLIVQYVPHAYGHKAMNVGFARWMGRLRTIPQLDFRVMFHEVNFPFVRSPLRHNLIAVANRWMLYQLLKAKPTIYIATDAWRKYLSPWISKSTTVTCLPVPSNIPNTPQVSSQAIRSKIVKDNNPDSVVIGHFGTFGGDILRMLVDTVSLLTNSHHKLIPVFVGRNTSIGVERLQTTSPVMAAETHAYDNLGPDDVAAVLQACDIVLQPYPDGVSGRRGSAMAGIANGIALVTNHGVATEDFWLTNDAVAISQSSSARDLAIKTLELVESESTRSKYAKNGKLLYDSRCSIDHTIRVLRGTND